MAIPSPESRPIGHRPALLAVLIATALLAIAPAARADVGETIILRCTHGESLSGFPPSAYARALKQLSADAEEYTNCASLIRQAQVAAAGGSGGGSGAAGGSAGGSAVATAATPAEQRSIAHAASAAPSPVALDGQVINPGVVHASVSSAVSTLPTPLLAMLALMSACAIAVAVGAARNRGRAGRDD